MPAITTLFHQVRTRFAPAPDGRTLVVCDEESAVGYDLTIGRERFTWKLAEHNVLGRPPPAEVNRAGLVRAVAVSPDGKTLAVSVGGEAFIDVSKRTHNLVLVETETGKVIRRAATPETSAGWLVFSPDGRRLAGPRCVWDTATLKEVRRFPARPEVTAAGFSPDGVRVVTGHVNGTVLVWAVGGQ
jgi:WD40 repeat protein